MLFPSMGNEASNLEGALLRSGFINYSPMNRLLHVLWELESAGQSRHAFGRIEESPGSIGQGAR